ncbi:MAG TPA: hypothetical protein VHO95_09860, partial [Candidatus Dormibacteraeota bacterium]|nr:hypothetical protein [Candidatus Dormibacteraeota bacterium]
MAAVDAPFENEPLESKPNRIGAWARWWLAGTPLDWGYVVLSGVLIATAYHFSWLNRNTFPLPDWANIPSQLAWLAITAYLAGA